MDHDVLDGALEQLAAWGPEYADGMANHGPMAVEALVVMDRADAVGPWVDRYVRRLEPWPKSEGRIARDAWRDSLGKSERCTAWRDFFEEELRESGWREVLAKWLPELAPGLAGAAAHGLIRVSHAARAIAQRETAPRERELAAALGYWAAVFQRLPEQTGGETKLSVDAALERIELLPVERRIGGFITSRLERLGELPSFAQTIDLVDVSGDASEVLSALTRASSEMYCSNAADRAGRIARLHALTGASALRTLLPHVSPETQRRLLRYGWQLVAGIYATHVDRAARQPAIELFSRAEELVAAAVDNGDEHALKVTEVALREHALAGHATFIETAAHAVRRR